MIFQNTIVHFLSLFIPNRDLRHSFRKKFKRKTRYRKLKDGYIEIKNDVIRIEQKINELSDYQNTIGRAIYFSVKTDIPHLPIYTGQALWKFIDEKEHIGGIYIPAIFSHEIFFYKRLSWISNKLFEYKTDLFINHGAWIYNPPVMKQRIDMMSYCLEFNTPLVFEEDGFIHSINSTAMRKNCIEYKTGFSMIVDAVSNHIDAASHTSIENELNSNCSYSDREIQRAKNLISDIVKNKISKYNGQPLNSDLDINFKGYQSIVLVVDQAYNDASIIKGYADANTFLKMLDAAIDENQNALILVKVHPDMIYNPNRGNFDRKITRQHGHFTDYEIKEDDKNRVKIIASYANPYTILDLVDKVYVCSSLMGFEALMAGKEVHIWGSPFYAGWGAGVQRTNSPAIERRIKRRSIEEIFICAYLNFSRYIDPFKYTRCELEDLIKSLILLRERYFSYKAQANNNFADFSEPVLSEEIPVAFAIEDDSLLNTKIAIATLLSSDNSNKYYIYCISTQGLSDKAKKEFSNIAVSFKNLSGLEFLVSGNNFDSYIRDNPNINKSDCIKFNIHNIVKNKRRVIYSDSNVVFMRGLSDAWESSEAFDSFIAAPPDLEENRIGATRSNERSKIWYKYFENCQGRYVSDSLMILNLDKLRKELDSDIWERYLTEPDWLNSVDIINLACGPKIFYLSCRYASNTNFIEDNSAYKGMFNTFFSPEDYVLLTEKTVAVHYPSESPPWQKKSGEQSRLWQDLARKNPVVNKILNQKV